MATVRSLPNILLPKWKKRFQKKTLTAEKFKVRYYNMPQEYYSFCLPKWKSDPMRIRRHLKKLPTWGEFRKAISQEFGRNTLTALTLSDKNVVSWMLKFCKLRTSGSSWKQDEVGGTNATHAESREAWQGKPGLHMWPLVSASPREGWTGLQEEAQFSRIVFRRVG